MTIAIILSAHGSLSKKLLHTAEIIAGTHQNIAWVELSPSENIDNLYDKYITSLSHLNTDSGVLFLVDMWGGTPFNAAQRIILNKNNYDIVTGVNVPMLIEVLLEKDRINSIKELVYIALRSGSESIKSVKFPLPNNISDNITTYPSKNHTSSNVFVNNQQLKEKYMTIALIRIDDRLIHGQIVTRWSKELKINRIIVINDNAAKDKIRSNLLTQVTPPGITAHIIDIQKAIRVYHNPIYKNDKVIMLFTNPTDIIHMIEGGVPIESVNVGGMSFHQSKKQIHKAISVNKEDIKAFKKLNQLGVQLEIRTVPSDSPVKLMMLIKNITE